MSKIASNNKSLSYLYIAILAIIACLVYINTINHGYVWDDQLVITQNPHTVKGIQGLVEIWTNSDYIVSRPIYRPVPQTLFALEWEMFPDQAKFGHIITILLYALCAGSLLVFLSTFFSKINKFLLFLIGLTFVLLPVHAEVVSNIKSSDEILSAIFVLWSFIALHKRTKWAYVLSFILLVLAILSKLSAITVIPFVLGYAVYTIQDFSKLKNKVLANKNYIAIALSLLVFLKFVHHPKYSIIAFTVAFILAVFYKKLIKDNWNVLLLGLASILLGYMGFGRLVVFLLFFFVIDEESIDLKNRLKLAVYLITPIIVSLLPSNLELSSGIAYALIFLIYILWLNKKLKFKIYLLPIIAIGILSLGMLADQKFHAQLIIPILLAILFFAIKAHKVKYLALLGLFAFFSYTNAYRLLYIDLFNPSDTEQVEIVPAENVILNEPYHNILVASDGFAEKSATICRIQLLYLKKLIWPSHLVHQHGTWQIKMASWKDWDVYASIGIHLFLLWLAFYFFKKKYYIAMLGILWYFATMSIYTNILRLMPDTLAERFLFLPSIGFSVAWVSGMYYFLQNWVSSEKNRLLIVALILSPFLSYYTFKTIDRSKDWENNYTLAANTLPYAEDNAAINAQYALELNNLIKYKLINNGDSVRPFIVKHYKKSIEIFPDFYAPNADLANYYILEAEPDKAFPYLKESVRINPNEWTHHYYLGLIYYERNNYSESISHFTELIQNTTLQSRALEFPELLEAYEYRARCLHNTGKDPDAYETLNQAISIFNQKSSYVLLANLYRVTGKRDLAIETFQRLLALTPNDQELINTITYLQEGKIY